MIETEQLGRCLTDFSFGDNSRAIDSEMLAPNIDARIEQAGETSSAGHKCRHVGAFESVAENAGIGQVGCDRSAAVFFADDVFDLAAKEGIGFLNKAILAESSGAIGYLSAERW